jgi:hypothetical protein
MTLRFAPPFPLMRHWPSAMTFIAKVIAAPADA